MTRTTLKIDGMSCGHCVGSVKRALEQAGGVTVAQVSRGTATVEFDPGVTSIEKLAEAVADAGYAATAAV